MTIFKNCQLLALEEGISTAKNLFHGVQSSPKIYRLSNVFSPLGLRICLFVSFFYREHEYKFPKTLALFNITHIYHEFFFDFLEFDYVQPRFHTDTNILKNDYL